MRKGGKFKYISFEDEIVVARGIVVRSMEGLCDIYGYFLKFIFLKSLNHYLLI